VELVIADLHGQRFSEWLEVKRLFFFFDELLKLADSSGNAGRPDLMMVRPLGPGTVAAHGTWQVNPLLQALVAKLVIACNVEGTLRDCRKEVILCRGRF
jgi:hypothetical protein